MFCSSLFYLHACSRAQSFTVAVRDNENTHSTSSSELTDADAPALALAVIASKNYSIVVMYCVNVLVSYRDD